jgi:hypothetical protein
LNRNGWRGWTDGFGTSSDCGALAGNFVVEKESQMIQMKSGKKLAQVIEKAIKDSVITLAEYEEITSVAYEDGILDKHEKALLRELNALIANKTVTFGTSSS